MEPYGRLRSFYWLSRAVVVVMLAIWRGAMECNSAATQVFGPIETTTYTVYAGVQSQRDFNFFLHDNLETGANPSARIVVQPVVPYSQNNNQFGAIAVLDDSMTMGPDVNSMEIGRGRGLYTFDSMTGSSVLQFAWTAVFNQASGYGGSTLNFQGDDVILDSEREIAISGGTGKFRLARGWATVSTYWSSGGAAILNITAHVVL